jgi:hypothetical protein
VGLLAEIGLLVAGSPKVSGSRIGAWQPANID